MYVFYGCFHARMPELSSCDRAYGPQSLKYLLSGHLQKQCAHPWVSYLHRATGTASGSGTVRKRGTNDNVYGESLKSQLGTLKPTHTHTHTHTHTALQDQMLWGKQLFSLQAFPEREVSLERGRQTCRERAVLTLSTWM